MAIEVAAVVRVRSLSRDVWGVSGDRILCLWGVL
jgi:hypothetical protein